MSKKLLIAVLTLGLFILFSAFAIADIATKAETEEGLTFDNRLSDAGVNISESATVLRPAAQLIPDPTPASIFPPIYYCDSLVGHGYTMPYRIPLGSTTGYDYAFMTYVSYDNYQCSLNTVNLYMSSTYIGTPDLEVVIWDDVFAYPVTPYGTITVPWASLPPAGGLLQVDVSSLGLMFEDGDAFNVGVRVTDASRLAGYEASVLVSEGTGPQFYDYAIYDTDENSDPPDPGWFWYGPAYALAINIEMCVNEIPYEDCETIEYTIGGYVWYFTLSDDPNVGYEYFHVRFNTNGPDSLKSIEYHLYNVTDSGVAVDFMVTGEAGGYPDITNIIYSETVAYDDIVYYGYTITFPEPCPVINGTFFGVVSVNDGTPGQTGMLSDDGGGSGTSGGYDGADPPGWFSTGYNFFISCELCDDKYSLCQTDADWAVCDIAYIRRLPGSYGTAGYFQKVQSIGLGCRIEEIRVPFYQSTTPAPYTETAQIRIMDKDGSHDIYDPGGEDEFDFGAGLPGTTIHSIDIPAADIIADGFYPKWMVFNVSAENIRYDEYVWVGVEILAPAESNDMILPFSPGPADDASCLEDEETAVFGYGAFEPWNYNTQGYSYQENFWSNPKNLLIDIDICCEPPPEADCYPGEDWPVGAHDFRRTNRSMNSTGDAQCQQTLSWYFRDISNITCAKGVITDGILIVPYNNSLKAFNVDTGAPVWTVSSVPWHGAGGRNSICVVDGWVYFGGGTNRGMSRVPAATGLTTAPGAWNRSFLNGPIFNGNTAYSAPVVLGDVVYISSTLGELAAFNIADGTNFSGWTVNPIIVDGDMTNTMSSNGVDVIYVGTNGNLGDGLGTLYAIDAATGNINWTMRDTDLLGHDLDGGDGTETGEQFRGSIAVGLENDLYMLSNFEGGDLTGPPSGVFYRIEDGGTAGSVVWGIESYRNYWNGPTLDVNNVYASTWGAWGSDVVLASMRAVNKFNGAVVWNANDVNEVLVDTGLAHFQTFAGDAVLDCQQLVRDILYMPNDSAWWYALNGDNGELEFEYNFIPYTSDNAGAIMMDATHVVFTNLQGEIFVMTNQVDRPRLRVMVDDIYGDVPFLSPSGYQVTFTDVIYNNGCANLTGTFTADEAAPASYYATSVHPDRQDRMSSAADYMTDNSYPSMVGKITKATGLPMSKEAEFEESAYSKDSYSNTAAYAPPAWLNGIVNSTFDVDPGDFEDVIYDINGPLVTRGSHDCYVTITSNDQFYLNDATLHKTIMLGVIGGCAASTDTLYWGTTIQNYSVIYNSGMIAGDARNDGFMISIDGEEDYFCYFAGFLLFGQSEHALAWTGHEDNFDWETLLADPNCAGQCETYFSRDIVLGSVWNGVDAYEDIYGEAGTYTYIDSIVDYGCNGSWDWRDITCPYDNDLTIGLSIKATEYGAYGVPELNNFKITKLDMTNRNATPIVDPVYMAHWVDGDLGNDYANPPGGYDWERYFYLDGYDVVWGGACSGGFETNTNIWGSGSIGHPMRGCINGRSDMLDGDFLYDSMFYWMSNVTGTYYQPNLDPLAADPLVYDCNDTYGDRQVVYLYDGFTFGANETVTTGFYIFGYSSITGLGYSTFDTALIINTALAAQQFAGFGRGDMNGDNVINLADVVALYDIVNGGGTPPRFAHLSDVNASGATDIADVSYLADYCFCVGGAPIGEWVLPDICPAP